jgi:sensor histidine kinase YesM
VHFVIKNKIIKCNITDNGIGINSSRNHKNITHESIGLKVVQNRLQLIPGGTEASINFTDLSDIHKDKHGTIVELIIPIL